MNCWAPTAGWWTSTATHTTKTLHRCPRSGASTSAAMAPRTAPVVPPSLHSRTHRSLMGLPNSRWPQSRLRPSRQRPQSRLRPSRQRPQSRRQPPVRPSPSGASALRSPKTWRPHSGFRPPPRFAMFRQSCSRSTAGSSTGTWAAPAVARSASRTSSATPSCGPSPTITRTWQ